VDEHVGLRVLNPHIFVTSRPEHDIQAVLKRLALSPYLFLMKVDNSRILSTMLAQLFARTEGCGDDGNEDKDLVIKTLSEKADGM